VLPAAVVSSQLPRGSAAWFNTLYRLMSVPLLRLTPALVRDLFGVSALAQVEYETEPPKRITPDTQQIVIRRHSDAQG
jgi:hypothetical protein